jgi:translation initiation factor 1 (eIF-1/SUI1)
MAQIKAEVQKLNAKAASNKISSFTKQTKKIKDVEKIGSIVIPVPLLKKGEYLVITIPSDVVSGMLKKASELPVGERAEFINDWIKDNINTAIDEYVEKGKEKFTIGASIPKIKYTPKKITAATPAPKKEFEIAGPKEMKAAEGGAVKPKIAPSKVPKVAAGPVETAVPSALKPTAKKDPVDTWKKSYGIAALTPSGKYSKYYKEKGYRFKANIKTKKTKQGDVAVPVHYRIKGKTVVKVFFFIEVPSLLDSTAVNKMADEMAKIISSYPTAVKGVDKIEVKKDMKNLLTKQLKNAGFEIK